MSEMQPYDPNHGAGYPPAPPPSDPYGGPYAPQPVYVQALPTSGYGTASLVFGILGLLGGWCVFGLPCLIAVILGHVGLNDTKNGRKAGRGNAIAGLILGYVVVIPAILICVLFVVGVVLGRPPE